VNEPKKPNPLTNEAPLNCVSLRSQLELELTWGPVKGLDERPRGTPLTATHVTTGGLCRWKAINKVGRHVGLDFYDLLIEGHFTSVRFSFAFLRDDECYGDISAPG
jgi:hypothetical protein